MKEQPIEGATNCSKIRVRVYSLKEQPIEVKFRIRCGGLGLKSQFGVCDFGGLERRGNGLQWWSRGGVTTEWGRQWVVRDGGGWCAWW